MLFNSFAFLLFLPVVFFLFWSLRPAGLRAQNTVLIAASYLFYGLWDFRFLTLLAFSSVVDYVIGWQLGVQNEPRIRRLLLGCSAVTQLGLLAFFKYFGFFIDSFAELVQSFGLHADLPTLRIILPVGISFYTFQTLSYTIDVYRGDLKPTRDPFAFFAFVSFFPQLVAGPIERATNLLPQFMTTRNFNVQKARDGLRQMLWGFFKKVVVADNIAGQVHAIFGASHSASAQALYIGVLLFAFQIYCDFSGYSDIAIGCARLFGVDLMRNFAYPYFSRDVAEFWRRWHISLSTWFRDYVYIPLGGNRVSKARRAGNVMVTFGLSGLWHGAAWNYVAWGLLNGAMFVPKVVTGHHRDHVGMVASGRWLPSLNDLGKIFLTFNVTLLAWVFFRADSLRSALSYLGRILTWQSSSGFVLSRPPLIMAMVLIAILLAFEWLQRERAHALSIEKFPLPLRWTVYGVIATVIVLFGNFGHIQFIYFQF